MTRLELFQKWWRPLLGAACVLVLIGAGIMGLALVWAGRGEEVTWLEGPMEVFAWLAASLFGFRGIEKMAPRFLQRTEEQGE